MNRFRSTRLPGLASGLLLAAWLSQGFAQGGEAPALGPWSLSGPYLQEGKDGASLFDVAFPPEDPKAKGVVWAPAAGTVGEGGTWVIDLAQLLGGENRAAYLRARVLSARAQPATLELGSDDGLKVWLNGKLVHANNAARGVKPGEDVLTIPLKKGENELLLKITQGAGGWGAAVRLAGAAPGAAPAASQPGSAHFAAYERYCPPFADPKADHKFSQQKHYPNMGEVQMDFQIHPILAKANEEAFQKGRWREALVLYRQVIEKYPNDLYQIAGEGIYIPAVLYAQLQLLAYPEKELSYYRILYDPPAKEIYQRAHRRFSIPDYKDLARYHLATSYGDDALFALGNTALDNAQYDEARRCYEHLLAWCGAEDKDQDGIPLDRDQVWVRLAVCQRHLGADQAYEEALAKIKNFSDPTVAELLRQLEAFRYDEFAVRQRENRRSAMYDAMDDKRLSEPLPHTFSANKGEWEAGLASAGNGRWSPPDIMPWATETDLIYKDQNILYCRSLLTGEMNWVFGPGGSAGDWDRGGHNLPSQSILVHEGAVFAHMFVYGPSLVAVDQFTGQMLWAKGPMAATAEDEWLDRYQVAPVAERGMVIAPVVHDDIRGRTHVASTAELAAFESRTGRLLWRKWLARVAPVKLTQSRYPRKLRILSSPPLVRNGVIYHVTNAGAVAAVDAQTGEILWLTRYEQRNDILDNFSPILRNWQNEPPLIRGGKLYVTPVDSPHLLCLDIESGRILWANQRGEHGLWPFGGPLGEAITYLVGFATDGSLVWKGAGLVFLDPESGRPVRHISVGGYINFEVGGANIPKANKSAIPKGLAPGINGEGEDFWWSLGQINAKPTLTRDGKVYFSTLCWMDCGGVGDAPFNSEFVYDMQERGIVNQRRWYSPTSFIDRFGYANSLPVVKRPVNEEPESFDPALRMTFTRWRIPFEVDCSYRQIVVRYDRKRLEAELAARKDLDTLFAKAEIARKQRDTKEAIRLYESCKTLLPSEEEDRRRNINLRLYPLYTELARWGHQAADYALLEEACQKMGATATNPEQEIRALLAYSELHRKRGDFMAAAKVLQNASRHYWRQPFSVSQIELRDPKRFREQAETALQNLGQEIPQPYLAALAEMVSREKDALDDYLLAVAPVQRGLVVETRHIVVERLLRLLAEAPAELKSRFEEAAAQELKRYQDPAVGERLLWCWPQAEAAKTKTRELLEGLAKLPPVERQALHWKMADLAGSCRLGKSLVPDGEAGLQAAPRPAGLPSGAGGKEREAANEDPDMVRLVLPQESDNAETAQLLFVGGRKRRAYGNRFNLLCWDMKANRKLWETPEVLLHSHATDVEEGYEVGFEEVLIRGDLLFVHGRYDVIAFNWREGQELNEKGQPHEGKKRVRWHFRTPLGFEIMALGLCGDVLVLCGRNSTLALPASGEGKGEILWLEPEAGEYYAGPYFHQGTLLTVRRSPAEVSFRQLGSGRSLSRLSLPGLTTNRKHPIYAGESGEQNPAAAQAVEAYPVACAEGVLAVVDGRKFHLVDIQQRSVRWSCAATKLDPSQDPAYRLWIDQGKLFVLKPYYSVLENCVFDLASGDMLWRRREGGRKVDLQKFGDGGQNQSATGVVLKSMTFLDGVAYGIGYEMNAATVKFVGLDAKGDQVLLLEEKGYSDPEAYVEPSWSKDCVVVRIQDGNSVELWQVDVKAKKIAQRIKLPGFGRLGNYGDFSAAWQGPHLALWAYEKRKFSSP